MDGEKSTIDNDQGDSIEGDKSCYVRKHFLEELTSVLGWDLIMGENAAFFLNQQGIKSMVF